MLHLHDEGVVGPFQRFVPVGQWHLQQCAAGHDQMGLDADSGVGVVEAKGADHFDRFLGWRTPRLGGGQCGNELGLGRRDRRKVEECHGRQRRQLMPTDSVMTGVL